MIHAPAPVLPSAGMRPTSLVGAPYMHLGRDPVRGIDCWGVVLLCKSGVPDYAFDPAARAAFARSVLEAWRDARWVELEEPADRCLVMLDRSHAGVWWRGRVVHATREDGVRSDPAGDLPLLGYRAPRFGEWIG